MELSFRNPNLYKLFFCVLDVILSDAATVSVFSDMDFKGYMIDKVIKKIEDVLEIKTIFSPNEHFCKVMSSGKDVLHNMQKLVKDTYKPPQLEGHGVMEGYYENPPVRSDALPRPVWSMNENDITVHRDDVDEGSKTPWNRPPPMPHLQNARGIVSDNGVPPAEDQGRNKEKGMTPEPEAVNHSRLLSDTGFHEQFYTEEQGRDKAEAVNYSSSQSDVDNFDQFESQMEWGSSILNGSLLEADPFDLLIVLLSVSIGLNLELFKDISAFLFVYLSLQNLFLIKQLKRDMDELVFCVPTGISKMAYTEWYPAYGETCIYSGCNSDTISLFKFEK